MDLPLPSAAGLPSVWKAEVAVPNKKFLGNCGYGMKRSIGENLDSVKIFSRPLQARQQIR
jgi:hypothetical protein